MPHGAIEAVAVGLKRIPLHGVPWTVSPSNYSIIPTPRMREARSLTRAASEGAPQLSPLDTTGVLDLHSRLLDGGRSTGPWQRMCGAAVPQGDIMMTPSVVLAGFWLQVDWILATEPPTVLQALTQIVGPQKLLEAIGEKWHRTREHTNIVLSAAASQFP